MLCKPVGNSKVVHAALHSAVHMTGLIWQTKHEFDGMPMLKADVLEIPVY